MNKWTVNDDKIEVRKGHDFFTAKLDFDLEGDGAHWNKVEIHGENADEALRLANIIAAALNEREAITDG